MTARKPLEIPGRGPYDCARCGQLHKRGCRGHLTKSSRPCSRSPIVGGTVCEAHGGKAGHVRRRAEAVAEVMRFGLGGPDVDPGVALLRLVSGSSSLVQGYATQIEQVVDQCGGDVKEALTGEVWVSDESGGSHKSGEYIRALARLYNDERDRLANFAGKAVAAGLAQRQVELQEQQGALMAAVFRMAAGRLGLSEEQMSRLPGVLAWALGEVTGERVIEGSAA